MSLQTITFTTQLKNRDPLADYEIKVWYEHYYGSSMGHNSEDPGEIDIQKAVDETGRELTDAEIEEIRNTCEYEIVTELNADREDHLYHNWKERNI